MGKEQFAVTIAFLSINHLKNQDKRSCHEHFYLSLQLD